MLHRRGVEDHIDPLTGPVDRVGISHIADQPAHATVRKGRGLAEVLLLIPAEDTDLLCLRGEEPSQQGGAARARSASDEHAAGGGRFFHAGLSRSRAG